MGRPTSAARARSAVRTTRSCARGSAAFPNPGLGLDLRLRPSLSSPEAIFVLALHREAHLRRPVEVEGVG